MVPPERLKPTAPLSQVKQSTTGSLYRYIIQLFGHCIATWYAMAQSQLKANGDRNQLWAWLDSDPKADL